MKQLTSYVLFILLPLTVRAELTPTRGSVDPRVRHVFYSSEQVYRLRGYVGYHIDLQFEAGETFVGLGAGDIEGLAYVSQDNHLFLKPRAAAINTNLTVLTNRRHYQFDYTAAEGRPDWQNRDAMYVVRFIYPPPPEKADAGRKIETQLDAATHKRTRNIDYWYCGRRELKPLAASDDGVHTRLNFGSHAEQPAIFVRNEDGSESLLNFSMDEDDVIIHRVARQLIVRRGKLIGCIVNKGYVGAGERLRSGTLAPDVERATQGVRP